jgi:hypothetical protein
MTRQRSPHPVSVWPAGPGGPRRWLAAPTGYRSPQSRSAWAQAALALLCGTSIALAVNLDSSMSAARGEEGAITGSLAGLALTGALLLHSIAVVASALTFTLWLRRLLDNLSMIVEHAMSPARATAYCLLPVVNLVMLPRVLKSLRETAGPLFTPWCVLWAVSEVTVFGLAVAAVFADGFLATNREVAWSAVLGGDALGAAVLDRLGMLAIANALVVALGSLVTLFLVRDTTRQHEIGEGSPA